MGHGDSRHQVCRPIESVVNVLHLKMILRADSHDSMKASGAHHHLSELIRATELLLRRVQDLLS